MSYTFLPPRLTNYYPRDLPYLAGMRGLGDYAADLAAFKTAYALYSIDYKKWLAEKAQYDADVAAWRKAALKIVTANTRALSAYKADLSAWNNEYVSWQLAVDAWTRTFAGYKKDNTARSSTIAQAYGLSLPQSYYDNGACLTQAQHAGYAGQCTTVKGIGYIRGMGSLDSDCGMAKLPVCQFGPYPTIRDQPTQPTPKAVPTKPALRAQPVEPTPPVAPPGVTTTPSSGGGSGPSTPDSGPGPLSPGPDQSLPANKQAGMVANGLLLVALIGGGYLVYRTLKKPKAQAA